MEFLKVQQQNDYPECDDICENYYITLHGDVYEGRGLLREGQSTYESLTSYNNKAISVSFLLENADSSLEDKQKSAFCWLLKDHLISSDIQLNENFKLYNQSALTSSFNSSWSNEKFDDCDLVWETRESKLNCDVFKIERIIHVRSFNPIKLLIF